MVWPAKVTRQFEKVPINPSEADFHGPYNKLLNTLFPPDTDFTVVPLYMPASRESDFRVVFEVLLDDKPVFILELKPPSDLRYPSSHEAADRHIRTRIIDVKCSSYLYLTGFGSQLPLIIDDCPLPVLHAVSAMGTRLCFSRRPRNGPLEPSFIAAHPELVLETDTAPEARWDCGILEEQGAQRFQAVV